MTTVEYKGFQGSVSFEDGHLLIQILHIDDFVTAECDKASDVEPTFKELVEDYLETCEAVGKEPCKPFKGSFNVRVGSTLHKKAAMAAVSAGETLNSWVTTAISQKLERELDNNAILELAFLKQQIAEASQVASLWAVTNAGSPDFDDLRSVQDLLLDESKAERGYRLYRPALGRH